MIYFHYLSKVQKNIPHEIGSTPHDYTYSVHLDLMEADSGEWTLVITQGQEEHPTEAEQSYTGIGKVIEL